MTEVNVREKHHDPQGKFDFQSQPVHLIMTGDKFKILDQMNEEFFPQYPVEEPGMLVKRLIDYAILSYTSDKGSPERDAIYRIMTGFAEEPQEDEDKELREYFEGLRLQLRQSKHQRKGTS